MSPFDAKEAVAPAPRAEAPGRAKSNPLLALLRLTTLVLAWVARSSVGEGTVGDASDRGYNGVVVGDCCASVSPEAHDASLTVALPFLATISTLDEVITALA